MSFSVDNLVDDIEQKLKAHPGDAPLTFWVAYSGGLDSTVLLHAMAQARVHFPQVALKAIHVHHGLQEVADQWVEHCRATCDALTIPLFIEWVDARADKGESPEAAARNARYSAMRGYLKAAGDVLLTAHHQDDQAETLLLQLLRGAGTKGLSGMPDYSDFGNGVIIRPLMDYSRNDLQAWAEAQQLEWVDDPTNEQMHYYRNYLRHQVMPVLLERWPGAIKTVSRSAALQAESASILESVAAEDLSRIRLEQPEQLEVSAILAMDMPRRNNMLRFWIQSLGLPMPSHAQLHKISTEMLPVARDRQPLVAWSGGQVRRFDDRLYAMRTLADIDIYQRYPLEPDSTTDIPGVGSVSLQQSDENFCIDPEQLRGKKLELGFRIGGEQGLLPGRTQHTKLKKLVQEASIPSWQRPRLVLLYADGELVCVAGHWVFQPFLCPEGKKGLTISIRESVNQD